MKITIYLSERTKNLLKEIYQKYHLSFSTIAQILTDKFEHMIVTYGSEFLEKYLDNHHKNKTMIKPNNIESIKQTLKSDWSTLSHVYSNILYLWVNKQYIYLFNENNENLLNKYVKKIEKQFFETKEAYWNDNELIRRQARIVRLNAPYYRKILQV